ncbi:hypothetical protein ACO0SA_001928 [Hanseniaspora valbyensis]
MAKLKFVNSSSNETAIIDVESFKTPVFDVIKNQTKILSISKPSDEESIKIFLINNVSLQIVTKKVTFDDIINKNLNFQQIGVTSSMKIGVFVQGSSSSTSSKPVKQQEPKKTTNIIENKETEKLEKKGENKVKEFNRETKAIAPTKKLNIDTSNNKGDDDDEDPQMGIDDFKNYYETIANKAHNKKDVYKDILAQKKLLLEECHVRIKFPDRTILQAKFTSSETSATLYDFIKSQLHNPDLSFELYFGHPLKVIKNSDSLYLIKDLKFDKRTSLIFETNNKKLPFLKKDLKLESLDNISKSNEKDNKISETKKDKDVRKEDTGKSKKQKLEDKMSKFLKLSKK